MQCAIRPWRDAISAAAIRNLSQFNPPDIELLAWASAARGLCNLPLRKSLAAAALPSRGSHLYASFLWSMAARG